MLVPRPGIAGLIYPLSILNEAALFFCLRISVAHPQRAVDVGRPSSSLSTGLGSWLHVLGAAGYVGLFFSSIWMVLRQRNALATAGDFFLLFPLLWFVTEFAKLSGFKTPSCSIAAICGRSLFPG